MRHVTSWWPIGTSVTSGSPSRTGRSEAAVTEMAVKADERDVTAAAKHADRAATRPTASTRPVEAVDAIDYAASSACQSAGLSISALTRELPVRSALNTSGVTRAIHGEAKPSNHMSPAPRYHERYPSLAAVNATYTPKKPSMQKPNARQPSANEGALKGRPTARRRPAGPTPCGNASR